MNGRGNGDSCQELRVLEKDLLRATKRLEKTENLLAWVMIQAEIDEIKDRIGWVLLDREEYEKGLAWYKSFSSSTQGEAKCNGMSRALIEMGCYDEARKVLEKGLKRFPESYVLWVSRGVLDQRLGYHLESFRCFQFALRFAPKGSSEALFNVSTALHELGHHEDATKVLEKLVEQYPYEPRFLVSLGGCRCDMGYPKEALKYYLRAKKEGYSSPGLYDGFYQAYRAMGLKKEALEMAEEGFREFPGIPDFYGDLAEAYFEMGWRKESREVLNEGLSRFPDDECLKDLDNTLDDPEIDPGTGNKPPLIGLIALLALIHKRASKK